MAKGIALAPRPTPDRGQPPGGTHLRELAREDPGTLAPIRRSHQSYRPCAWWSRGGIPSWSSWRTICGTGCSGRTRDDAAGEAFDKVARLLGLGLSGWAAHRARSPACPPGAGSATTDPALAPWHLRLQLQRRQDGDAPARRSCRGHRRADTPAMVSALRRSLPADGRGCPGRQDLPGGGPVSRPGASSSPAG